MLHTYIAVKSNKYCECSESTFSRELLFFTKQLFSQSLPTFSLSRIRIKQMLSFQRCITVTWKQHCEFHHLKASPCISYANTAPYHAKTKYKILHLLLIPCRQTLENAQFRLCAQKLQKTAVSNPNQGVSSYGFHNNLFVGILDSKLSNKNELMQRGTNLPRGQSVLLQRRQKAHLNDDYNDNKNEILLM